MGLRHSSGCKIGSSGNNVDELGRSALVRRGGDEWVGRWWGGPVEREPRIQGAESVRQLRRGEAVVDFQVDFQTEGEGATLCIGSVQDTCMAANGLGAPVPNGESENVTGPAYRGRFIGNM
jgi:hypothetical protein